MSTKTLCVSSLCRRKAAYTLLNGSRASGVNGVLDLVGPFNVCLVPVKETFAGQE